MAKAAALTGQPAAIVEMIASKEIVLNFDLSQQSAGVLVLLKKYAGMELADACIVPMTELIRDCKVITVDRNRATIPPNPKPGRGRIQSVPTTPK